MQTYDLLMVLVLVAATMFGFWKGLAWQVASVASLTVSYFASLRFSPQLAPKFGDTAPWNRFVAMLAIFIGTSFVIWTIYRLVAGIIDRVKLKEFDHQLGAVLGLAKGVLWCIGITFFAVTLLPNAQKEAIISSQAGQYIVVFLSKADAVVPPEIHQVIGPYLQRVQQRLDPNFQAQQGNSDINALWPGAAQAAGNLISGAIGSGGTNVPSGQFPSNVGQGGQPTFQQQPAGQNQYGAAAGVQGGWNTQDGNANPQPNYSTQNYGGWPDATQQGGYPNGGYPPGQQGGTQSGGQSGGQSPPPGWLPGQPY